MAKPKASKQIETESLVQALTAAHDGEVSARKQRITALREWSKQTAGCKALSDKDVKHITAAVKAGYVATGAKEESARVMAAQDVRFLKAYNSDAAFRANADKQDSVTACFKAPGKPQATLLQKAFRAIKKAKLDNRAVALQFIADHPERALVLIENHIKEVSQLSSQLRDVSAKSEGRKAA